MIRDRILGVYRGRTWLLLGLLTLGCGGRDALEYEAELGAGGIAGQGGQEVGGTVARGGASARGGFTSVGGAITRGGSTPIGGFTSIGGWSSKGGSTARGGFTSVGGAITRGGSTARGGFTSVGGAITRGGSTARGGFTSVGGAITRGGSTARGGFTSVGGAITRGGSTAMGGSVARGGACSVMAFEQPTRMTYVGAPVSPLLSDLNLDGRLDLVAVEAAEVARVNVHLGRGNGTFSAATSFTTPAWASFAVAGDLNRDGLPDLVVTASNGDSVVVALGKGGSTFTPTYTFTVGTKPYTPSLGDIDGDGILDLVLTSQSVSAVAEVRFGTGTGQFGKSWSYSLQGGSVYSSVLADLNRDGMLDLVTANMNSGTLDILAGTAKGVFAHWQTLSISPSTPVYVAAADVNSDGALDLVTANWGTRTMNVFLNDGKGTFGISTQYVVGSEPRSLAIGDFDGDLDADIAIADAAFGAENVVLYLGDGKGSFQRGLETSVTGAFFVTSGDIDGNGRLDLAVGTVSRDSSGSGAIQLLLNRCK
jgi:hypothetical protein